MRSNTNHLLLVAAALAVALCPASAALSSRELGSADCPSCSSHTTANGVTITDDFETAWMSRKAMPYSCSDASATTIKDQIYLVGGCVEKQAWVPADPNDPNAWASYVCPTLTNKGLVFDPSKNTFAAIAASPRQRYRHTAASVGGKLYLFGGRDVTDTLVGDVDEFDPATGAWKAAVCSMGALAVSDLAAFVHEGVASVAGGYDAAYTASNATYKFVAPTASAPTCSFARVVGGDMHTPRGDFAIAEVKGKAYAVGGFTHTNWDMPQSSMETFDTATNTWSLRPSAMSVARGDKVVLALNSAIHVVGGETKDAKGNSVPIEVVEMYLESTGKFRDMGKIPSHRFRFMGAVVGSSMYIFGGQGFLQGKSQAVGSYYPVLNLVDEFKETPVQTSRMAAATGRSLPALAAALCVLAALRVWRL